MRWTLGTNTAHDLEGRWAHRQPLLVVGACGPPSAVTVVRSGPEARQCRAAVFQMRQSGVMTDPGRSAHWWYSRADRARIEGLSDEIDEAHRLAEAATDERSRDRHLRSARRLERTRRTRRTYPLSVWLWGASIVVVILPWSILARAGHSGIGLAVSAAVLVGVLTIRLALRRQTHQCGSST